MTSIERYKLLLMKSEAERDILLVETAMELDKLNARIDVLKKNIQSIDVSARGDNDE